MPDTRGLYPERRATEQGAFDRAVETIIGRLLPPVDRAGSRRLRRIGGVVAARAAADAALSDTALRAALTALRTPMRQGSMERGPVTSALALLAEACRRATGLQPHPVQLMGAMALVEGGSRRCRPAKARRSSRHWPPASPGWPGCRPMWSR